MLIMQGNFTMIYYFLEECILNIYTSDFILQLKHTLTHYISIFYYLNTHCLCTGILKANFFVDVLILYNY